MLIRFANRFSQFGTMCGFALVVASGIAFAGEKIRFSDEPDKAASSSKRPKADLSRPFDSNQSAPGGTEATPLAPPPPASKTRDPKVEELIDQKKNWIFSTPSKADSDSALKEMFKVREYKLDEVGTDRRPKSAIDSYFEHEAEARKEISAKLNARGKDSETGNKEADAAESNSIVGLPLEQGTRSAISPASELEPGAWARKGSAELGSPISASPGDLNSRNFHSADVLGLPRHGSGSGPGQFFGQERREQRLEEFQKTIGVINPGRPALLRDPINLQSDGTRQPLNPVLGTGSPGIGTGLDTGFRSVGGLAGPGGRSSISDLMNSRPPSGASLSPAVIMPSSPGFMQPRPAVLEIPRRKF
jgi:hypothetical protein